MRLVAASLAHGPAMAAIHAAAFPAGERWGADALTLQLSLPGAFGFLAEAWGFVLARVAADEAEILTLAVLAAHRRQGVAARLLQAASDAAAGAGAKAMLLEVAVSNAPACALYAAQGFVQVGRRRGYYAAGADALVLRRILEPDSFR